MQIALFSTALAIVLFLCFLYAFEKGLRLGKTVGDGKPIPTTNTVKTVTNAVQKFKADAEAEKTNKDLMRELNEIMGYTGDEPDKQGR